MFNYTSHISVGSGASVVIDGKNKNKSYFEVKSKKGNIFISRRKIIIEGDKEDAYYNLANIVFSNLQATKNKYFSFINSSYAELDWCNITYSISNNKVKIDFATPIKGSREFKKNVKYYLERLIKINNFV